ncbi:MAG: carbohydrate ABC transporter permease, partial [Lachnospiraceae bacterium]|nr:carbohydrate ABC transporter permease [Lachnospiraceae bacterium]
MSEKTEIKKYSSKSRNALIGKIILYLILILITVVMAIPFLWMLSASIKSDREVFQMNPFVWIPEVPKWDNYIKIWTKIPMLKFVENTVFLTIVVTLLQLLTSSFAAYSFAKLEFKHKNTLFLAYIATIAMPWQVYMVPQF